MPNPQQTPPFSHSLRAAIALTLALIAVFSVYVYSEKQIDAAHEHRYSARLLAEELGQSSDDLTRMVRSYVLTGHPVYRQTFLDILDIREGKKTSASADRRVGWNLTTQPPSPVPDAPKTAGLALLDRVQQLGLTEAERAKLTQSKANSDALTRLELTAMALVESASPDDLPGRRLQASELLQDDAYHQAKAGIMQPLSEFYVLLEKRTLQQVETAVQRALYLRVLFVVLGMALLAALWRSYAALHATLGGSVEEVHGRIVRLGQGDFSDSVVPAGLADNSVLDWLGQTQRQLKDTDAARQVADRQLRRLTQLYAAVTDCNQAIVRSTDARTLFAQVCRIVVEHGNMKMAWIGLMGPDSRRIHPIVSYGAGVQSLADIFIAVDADDLEAQGPVSAALRCDQPFWCQDFLHNPATEPWHALGARFGWAAIAALPLHRDGQVIGALNVHAGEVDAFDEQAQGLLLEMASDIERALKNFDRDAQRDRELALRLHAQRMDTLRSFMLECLASDLLLDHVLQAFVLKIEETLPGALCSVLLLDEDRLRLTVGAAPSLPDFYNAAIDGALIGPLAGSCGTSAYTGQRVVVGDIASHPYWVDYKVLAQQAGLAACWSEPIRSGQNRVLGTFAIYQRTPALPASFELEIITMAAHLTALAIERKRAEQQLQLTGRVFEQGGESIVITDSENRIVRVNKAFSQITGYTEAEALGRNPSMLSSGRQDADFFRVMWATLHASGLWQGELWNRRKDGSLYPEWLSISQLRDSSGAVTHYVAMATDISQRKKDEEHIRLLADFDPLTGLPNRRLLQDRIGTALAHAQRQHEPVALIFLDLDRFKNVNDSLGHHMGDNLLRQVAQRLTAALREQDTVCRLGGDEFVVLCPNIDAVGATHVAQKLLDSTHHSFQMEPQELAITFSIGIALYPADGSTYEVLSMRADTAMYRAKQAGRNTYRFFTPEMQVESSRALQLENGLRRALELQQLHLVYQPQVSLNDDQLVGMEALLRWEHPVLGTVSPAEFIPVAEESGLILPIGEWVLRTAAQQMRTWLQAGLPLRQVAVNLSAVQFRHQNLPDLVTQVLADVGLASHYLELELTEGVAMENPRGAIEVMKNLHQRGVRLSIDDFGTGYSSLSYLKRFPVYKLKIDQSFVRDLSDDPDDRAIVVAIIGLARSLGFQTIAEGVETEGQLAFLREQGCDEVQGYWHSKPLPADAFEAFVRQRLCNAQPSV
jgi:diguanylate cyclase (GGDEF)-like protein/PAS domain S-box-containing protein